MEYRHREYDKAAVKAFVAENYPYKEIIAAFEKVDYDLEEFFISKANEAFQEEEFYMSLFLEFRKDLIDYFVDLANGYWEIPSTGKGVVFICRLLFLSCWTDEDIWDLLYDYCPVKTACQIYKCYTGESYIEGHFPVYLKDPMKAARMLEYFKNKD